MTRDVLGVYQNNDQRGILTFSRDFLIPHDAAWFIDTFGPTNGPLLDLQYRHQFAWQFSRLDVYLHLVANVDKTLISVRKDEPGAFTIFEFEEKLWRAASRPLPIYSVAVSTDEIGPWFLIGHFVYVNGSFRYLGFLDLQQDWSAFFRVYSEPFRP